MAKIITVSTVQGLYAALAQAKGGETISLAAGDYGSLFSGGKSGASLNITTVTGAFACPVAGDVPTEIFWIIGSGAV